MDHRNAELRSGRWFQKYANQSVLQEQAVICRAVLPRIRAVGAVNRRKQGIATASLHEALLDTGRIDAHRLTRHMAGGTAAPVAAEGLKEGAMTIDWTIDAQRHDHAAGIAESDAREALRLLLQQARPGEFSQSTGQAYLALARCLRAEAPKVAPWRNMPPISFRCPSESSTRIRAPLATSRRVSDEIIGQQHRAPPSEKRSASH
jgi:hypothetical protein